MLFNGEKFRKNRLTAAAFLYVWLVITILVGVGQFFYYTSDKKLREVNKPVKISTYVAFTFDYVGSGNLIKVKPFGTRIDSSKWLSILENKSPQEYAVLNSHRGYIVCNPANVYKLRCQEIPLQLNQQIIKNSSCISTKPVL